MYERDDKNPLAGAPSRRKVVAGFAVAFGGLLVGAEAWGKPQQPTSVDNKTRTSLHQEIEFTANPRRIYEALLDSKQFATVTGMAAKIDSKPGGAFTTFGGMIMGRNVELIRNQRIVQAWRPASWKPGQYSVVKFELTARGHNTVLVLDHTGFPEGDFDSLGSGWPERYWEPLKKFLA